MNQVDNLAEQVKLELLLETETNSLAFVSEQDALDTRAFREQAAEFFYNRQQDAFHRLASMSKLLPIKMSAKLATSLMGPVLSAGIACELPLDKAVKLADKLPTHFLAKLSLYLDPKRATPIISAVSEDHIVAVAEELNKRKAYVTLARFLASIKQTALNRIIDNTGEDGESLLKTGMYVEDKTHLDMLVRHLSEPQRRALLAAADELELWPEALSMVPHLKPDMQVTLANLAGQMAESIRDKLMQSIAERNAWEPLFIALAAMNENNLQRCAALPSMHDKDYLTQFIQAANEQGQRKNLNVLFSYFDEAQKTIIA